MSRQLNLFIISFLVLVSYSCFGQNGKTAYSYPLTKIKIDGKMASLKIGQKELKNMKSTIF